MKLNFLKTSLLVFSLFASGEATFAAGSKTIAVPDLGYKQQVETFFYFEAASAHSSESAISRSSAREYDNQEAGLTSRDRVNAGVGYAEGDSAVAAASSRQQGFSGSSASNYNSNNDSSYVKTYHNNIRIQYGELRGMAARVRAILLQDGYAIKNVAPKIAKLGEGDAFFDINKRIKKGEMSNADYVLYGVIAAMDYEDDVEEIQGTNKQMNIHVLNMTVDYTLIDTNTLNSVASFSVFATGTDNKLSNGRETTPSTAKIVAALGEDLASGVAKELSQQGIIRKVDFGTIEPSSRSFTDGQSIKTDVKVYPAGQ